MAKEAQVEKEKKEQQIEELTSLVEETRQSLQAEYEAKVWERNKNIVF